MSARVKIVGVLTARPGKTEELQALLLDLQRPSRAEPGNLRWDIWQDQANPDRFVLDELYASQDAADAHLGTPHFQDYVGRVKDLADRTPMILSPINVCSGDKQPNAR
jgi:quinol monooxygenase YgiN